MVFVICVVFFFKQKTAYEMRISDWSSDVCSSDLREAADRAFADELRRRTQRGRESGDDTGKDDHRNTIAYAAFGDLLAEPHQEHGAGDQRQRRNKQEADARVDRHPGLPQRPGTDRTSVV